MRDPAARRVGVTCAAACLAMAATAPVLARGLEGAPGVPYTVLKPQDLFVPVACALIGAALVWLRTRNAVGWLLLAIGTCGMAGIVLGVYGIRAHVHPSAGLPAADVALALANWLWLPALFLGTTLLPLLYPTGRLPSPRWRAAVVAVVVGLAALLPVAASSADAFDDWHADARPPLTLPTAVSAALLVLGVTLLVLSSVACLGNAAVRLWRARRPERAQLAWLLTAVTAAAVLTVATPVEWIFQLALAMIPVAVAVGVLRYGLLGIEVVLRPALLYGLLTVLVALVFAGVTTGLSAVLPTGPAPTFLAAAVVAVGLVPAYVRIRRFVGRLIDGPAADPLLAVSGVGRASASGGAEPLTSVLAAVAAATGAERVRIRDSRDGGIPDPRTVEVPLASAGEDYGVLEITAPPRGFTGTARGLVDALAPHVAVVVRAAALTAALEEARRRLVDAAQDERNRLRRDLHDGLGPSLTGVALGLEATQNALPAHPEKAQEILRRLGVEVRGAVDEVHRILDGLRPSGLDALGLADALRVHAIEPGSGLDVEVAADPELGTLDPEIEVAAYRIALEAVTNARRHAGAAHCAVRLSADDAHVGVQVTDDGRGLPATPHEGVGLVSMRHRAEALGGEFRLRTGAGGTTVLARLPRQRP